MGFGRAMARKRPDTISEGRCQAAHPTGVRTGHRDTDGAGRRDRRVRLLGGVALKDDIVT